ncbi:MAG: hypothetical protein P8172_14270 [Gammaproteobacteria bacterium]
MFTRKRNNQSKTNRVGAALPVVVFLLVAGPSDALAENRVTDHVTMKTEGEGLFGPGRAPTASAPIEIILNQATPVEETFGEIYENVPSDVPLDAVLGAYDRAMTECTKRRGPFQTTSFCQDVYTQPSQSTCETASSIRLPEEITLNCCGSVGVPDVNATYPGCGFFGWKTNVTINLDDYNVNRDVSIPFPENVADLFEKLPLGSRPTAPIPRPFDAGAEVSALAEYEAGLELQLNADSGSVDVTYMTDVVLESSAAEAIAGDVVTLSGRHVPNPEHVYMESDYPNLEMLFRYFVGARIDVVAEIAHMDTAGRQYRGVQTVFDFDTGEVPGAAPDGRLYGEIFRLQAGLGGVEVSVFSEQPEYLYELDGFPEGTSVSFGFPLSFSWDVTYPFTCPVAGIPLLGNWLCPLSPILSTDLFEIGISTPEVNTPVGANYDGGYVDRQNTMPLRAQNNVLGAEGGLTSSTPAGFRNLFSSIFDAVGSGDLDDIFTDDGKISSDFARLDMDFDGLLSILVVPPNPLGPPTNPLGGNVAIGSAMPDPSDPAKSKKAASLEYNFLDVDFANWFSVDQTLHFDPGLVADLRFSQPVRVRDGDSGPFSEPVSEWPLKLGTVATSLQFIMPPGGVTITPSYSPRENLFTNTTDIVWTGALQQSLMQLKLQGLLYGLLGETLGIAAPSITLAQTTLATDPSAVGQFGGTPYALEGLSGLEFPGTPLTIMESSSPFALCDLNDDGDIDLVDIRLITGMRWQTVPPASPAADADSDGVISVNDARICVLRCSLPRCALAP